MEFYHYVNASKTQFSIFRVSCGAAVTDAEANPPLAPMNLINYKKLSLVNKLIVAGWMKI